MRDLMSRSEALDYFSNFKGSDEVLFTGYHAFFLSRGLEGVVQVSGDPVKRVLKCGFLENAEFIDYNSIELYKIKKKVEGYYANYFYIEKSRLAAFLNMFKIREKKKSNVVIESHKKIITLSIVNDVGQILNKIFFSAKLYETHKWINVSDFTVSLNAYNFDRIIFCGFPQCDRIGIKLDNDFGDVIFFNKNKTRSKIFWSCARN